jgi:GMP reductase
MKHLKYSDVALVPNYSEVHSRVDCSTSVRLGDKKFKLPIVPANMKSVINMDLARWMSANQYFYIMHRFDRDLLEDVKLANLKDWQNISFSTGAKMKDKMQVMNIGKNPDLRVDFLTVDIAHGHSERMKVMISHIKKWLPHTKIIAGNVATTQAVSDLVSWGADIVKVGIGQGSPCTTKDKTGFTIPMFSCVQECANAYFNLEDGFSMIKSSMQEDYDLPQKATIIADGGVKHNGDIAKALSVGATMVMAGGIFASCSDSPAISGSINESPYKAYFGSASSENKGHTNNVEGKLIHIPLSNMTYEEKLNEIEQDLQSSISYSGGSNLSSLNDAKYIEV